MNPKRFLYLGLLIVALIVAACGPDATPAPTAITESPTYVPSETEGPAPSETEGAAVSESEVPMGFTEEGTPYRGNPDAPVTLVEYSEFQ